MKNHIKYLTRVIYQGLCDFPYLIKSRHSARVKRAIFFNWLKLNTKWLFMDGLFGLKRERFFQYDVRSHEYNYIRFLFGEIFYRNEYMFDITKVDPIIFDCGANIGIATIFFKWLYPESKVYAFEPTPRAFELLKKNVEQNKLPQVRLFNAAVTGANGKMDFFTDTRSPWSVASSAISERTDGVRIVVEGISISSFIKKEKIDSIDMLKMDIEGSEKGVVDDLNKNGVLAITDRLIVEYHHKISERYPSELGAFLKIFEDAGFEYQINTKCVPVNSENKFQDVLIYFYKKTPRNI